MEELTDILNEDNKNILEAGHGLAKAVARVVEEYDGVHRLSLALSKWYLVIANRGDRGIKQLTKGKEMQKGFFTVSGDFVFRNGMQTESYPTRQQTTKTFYAIPLTKKERKQVRKILKKYLKTLDKEE